MDAPVPRLRECGDPILANRGQVRASRVEEVLLPEWGASPRELVPRILVQAEDLRGDRLPCLVVVPLLRPRVFNEVEEVLDLLPRAFNGAEEVLDLLLPASEAAAGRHGRHLPVSAEGEVGVHPLPASEVAVEVEDVAALVREVVVAVAAAEEEVEGAGAAADAESRRQAPLRRPG
jgi:hypothetical protein